MPRPGDTVHLQGRQWRILAISDWSRHVNFGEREYFDAGLFVKSPLSPAAHALLALGRA